jgi:hypothetical protein
MSTPAALAARQKTLNLIQQAQTLLYQAAQTASPIVPWADQWTDIGDTADAVKALWHRVNGAPYPERLDSEESVPVSLVPPEGTTTLHEGRPVDIRDHWQPMDLKRSTGREG